VKLFGNISASWFTLGVRFVLKDMHPPSFYQLMPSASQVFNQYYWDLLKKVKDIAKDLKYRSDDLGSREVLGEIKQSYATFDKSSHEHVDWYRSHASALDAFIDADGDVSSKLEWHKVDGISAIELYKGITLGDIARMFRNKNVILYFIVLLSLFAREGLEEPEQAALIELLKNQPWKEEDIHGAEALSAASKVRLVLLHSISEKPKQESGAKDDGPDALMSELENTSLGRLAKEIMNDVNVDEISKSIGEEGDILKVLSNPDGGITKLLGTVSQKMISKLASGELKQDTLLQDAMKLASTLPNTGGLGDMGSMLQQVSKMASMFGGMGGMGGGEDAAEPDMASMMTQLASMMGGGGGATGKKGARTVVNQAAVNRAVRSKQLRKKLDERRKKHEQSP
jgi:hypothetical protein